MFSYEASKTPQKTWKSVWKLKQVHILKLDNGDMNFAHHKKQHYGSKYFSSDPTYLAFTKIYSCMTSFPYLLLFTHVIPEQDWLINAQIQTNSSTCLSIKYYVILFFLFTNKFTYQVSTTESNQGKQLRMLQSV